MENEKATAEDASYDLESQTIDLNGSKGKQVVVWRDTYILLCDDLKIFFKETPDGKLEIDQINGRGHVQLSSPDELIEGDKAIMTPASNMVDIHGDVRVNRKQGQLRGPHAQVNLDTKVSKMLQGAGGNTSERVRVLVFPKEIDKNTIGGPKDKR
jgi:lipopolysaccharide export system protein LptA